jgi:hypothetical protein
LAERVRQDFGVIDPQRHELQLGGLVGECEMVDCIAKSDSPWFGGPFGFCLTNAKPILFRKLRGRLSLFNVHSSEIE